jgi:type 1 fimbria pilin
MAKTIFTILVVFGVALAHDVPKGKLVTITGTVVDTGCYVSHDSKGEAHTKCAEACAKNGVPLAILDEHGILFMPIAVEHKDQNAKLGVNFSSSEASAAV